MKHPLILPVCLSISLLGAPILPAFAQASAPPSPQAPPASPTLPVPPSPPAPSAPSVLPAPPAAPVLPEQRFDLILKGVRAQELAEYLRQKSSRTLSIIFADRSGEIEFPAIVAPGVTLEQSLILINRLGEIDVEQGGPGYSVTPVSGVDGVYTFQFLKPQLQPRRTAGGPAAEPEPVRVFLDLAPILSEELKIEDISTAIYTAWGSTTTGGPDALKFHQETKLLVVKHSPEMVTTAQAVVNLLQSRVQQKQERENSKEKELYERRVTGAMEEKDQMERQNHELRQEISSQRKEMLSRIMELEIELAKARAK